MSNNREVVNEREGLGRELLGLLKGNIRDYVM